MPPTLPKHYRAFSWATGAAQHICQCHTWQPLQTFGQLHFLHTQNDPGKSAGEATLLHIILRIHGRCVGPVGSSVSCPCSVAFRPCSVAFRPCPWQPGRSRSNPRSCFRLEMVAGRPRCFPQDFQPSCVYEPPEVTRKTCLHSLRKTTCGKSIALCGFDGWRCPVPT